MKKFFLLSILGLFCGLAQAQSGDWRTKFELSKGTETVTYAEGIAYFERLAAAYPEIKIFTYGTTDFGLPLHLVVFDLSQRFDPQQARQQGKNIVLINNAIHPGEPDGVEASMLLLREAATNAKMKKNLENTVLAIIPFYNIGGVHQRGAFSRVNQKGPQEYGFRGNAKNYDLNRDFIKTDSQNMRAFATIFQYWQPDVFVDNHVTNGADYQHVLTYLATQPDKLGGSLGQYLRQSMIPALEKAMQARKFPMCPYVNVFGQSPDKGYPGFLDSPRYSSGYAALFATIGFVVETHMLKPYAQRVEATKQFMEALLVYLQKEGKTLQALRRQQQAEIAAQKQFAVEWQQVPERHRLIDFLGYEAVTQESRLTGQPRRYYDRSRPFRKQVPFFEYFEAKHSVEAPQAYIIPKAWREVIALLRLNGVQMDSLAQDQVLEVEAAYIQSYKSYTQAYEGHYPHYDTRVRREKQKVQFYKGDWVVQVQQPAKRYLIEVLEPEATDSFFNWNFFDTILQQKEGYSDYVFEDLAEQLLAENADLAARFATRKKEDPEFAKNHRAQLDFIYKNSPYYEIVHLRYPIFRR